MRDSYFGYSLTFRDWASCLMLILSCGSCWYYLLCAAD
jgi:hypothetical protein